ncbi:V-type proton ATPase subunit C 1-A-like [Biomphalaria glabrata]|uniref:V-type proton ATPase subunit C n=1 Tax=Biomphalaria glabrata TaxID=6526 RepID=A0A9W3BP96_BIOGL|nr:V-type proton ATPase subunit C 1-A-like [Biomphalaria glabrata]XP_055901390.1 V-type proton ATPase subunit C 1-A-like [Biomphalaria glabrata]KAI8729573.1 V-type proton ATPase subunit C 1-A-like [Biomphalaria glabrata]KAI8781390.1 V-type proton ATPase subunit C 1-A [Biomphalaria glabrata]
MSGLMNEYWLISAPGDKTPQNTFERLNQATKSGSDRLSENFKFNIPDLKVGTLDVLVGLSDDLNKTDLYTESIVRKTASTLEDVLESSDKGSFSENLRIGGDTPPQIYMQKFSWDLAKYPVKQPLRAIADVISKDVSHIEEELKTRYNKYNNLKGNLQQLERKATGSLLTRSVAELVKKEDFILDSEYLITLVVVIPKTTTEEWMKKYERLTDKVVPRSSRVLFEDAEHQLVSVTVFRLVQDEFKNKCRENKFMVREFQYNEEEIQAGKTELEKLNSDKKKKFGPLVKWLKINFSEAFVAWMHIKALRVFVESVLRYGLPVNFQAMLIRPIKKNHKRLREILNQLYGHLDSTALSGEKMRDMEIPGLNLTASDYYPYVFYKITLDMLDSQKI